MDNVAELIRQMELDDKEGQTTISKYVSVSLREDLETIDAYLHSKHITGDTDSMGRDKPFFNIVTAACNIWYRATDIDRKNIRVLATKSGDFILSFLATIHIQEWMRRSSFGVFLNDWGRTLARYGSAVLKFVEKDGELFKEVIPWNRLLCDAVDFENNPVIEKLWLTPAQLRQRKGYDQKIVEELIESGQGTRQTMDGQNKDTKDNYILIYEVHGELPLSYLTGKDDDTEYVQQCHVVTFVSKKGSVRDFDDFTLFKGRESKNPYMITHLIKEDGYTLATGAVKHLFQAQWMMNHTIKTIKDQLDLASKLVFQTSDGNFVGQNVLKNIENGDILTYQLNQPLTQLNNNSHDITSLQNFGNEWKLQGNEATNVSESMMGTTAPSGTPWRQVQALLQESHSLFEIMTENKGMYIEEMFTKYVIPFIKKKMDTSEEIAATLDEYQIKQLDQMYVPNEAVRRSNRKIVEKVLKGEMVTPEEQAADIEMGKQELQQGLNSLGNQRFIKPSDISTKTWKEVLKGLEWDLIIDVTGEQLDTRSAMETYQTALTFLMGLQGRPLTEDERFVFNKLISSTGHISPLELSTNAPQPVGQTVAGSLGATQPTQAMQTMNGIKQNAV